MLTTRLLILDVDGVLTDGTKVYDKNHDVLSKRFMCKDFSAIKRFIAAGIKVVMISGDSWNREMAQKRNIDFYCTRDYGTLNLDKSVLLDKFQKKYEVYRHHMTFVGDDYFDLSMFQALENTFCTADSPDIIKQHASIVLKSKGGEGVIRELYDLFIMKKWIREDPDIEKVLVLDRLEQTSQEMK